MKKRIKKLCWIVTPIILIALSTYFKVGNIPSTLFIRDNQKLNTSAFISIVNKNEVNAASIAYNKGHTANESKASIKIFGIIPVKSVVVDKIPNGIMVYPGGQPIGIKLNTKGVLVVALSDIDTLKGKITSPSSQAGIQVGDSIIKVNGIEVNTSEEVLKQINLSKGQKITLTIDRKGNQEVKKVTPILCEKDNCYKIGLWIRDSTAGVGTLTFYDENTKKFAALGHPITDVDTGTILKVNTGQIVTSNIISIRKGEKGNPGELRGIFINEDYTLGNIEKNTQCGVYGKYNESLRNEGFDKPMKIALRDEIKEGSAKILTTIDGGSPKLYDIQIEKLLSQDSPGPKSMVIRVTDPVLLQKTGGIVQGMSGSPIIQDNKLVGAVTHVLVNKPDVGYGIYIEWMIKDAGLLQ